MTNRRSLFRAIAEDTLQVLQQGQYRNDAGTVVDIASAVIRAAAGTRLFLPDDAVLVGGATNHEPVIEVTTETTLAAAHRLSLDGDVAALVFASARNPGGGFLSGAQAQEESIARSSALYPCQLQAPGFYTYHRKHRDLRYSDRVIHSPAVPVFRDDAGQLLETPYQTAFLTAAAPNLGAILSNQPERADSVPEVLRHRAVRVLEIAAAHGHRRLVLGAWGCGVFRNDPAVVADAFSHALEKVARFDHVVFAIYGTADGAPVRPAFSKTFP